MSTFLPFEAKIFMAIEKILNEIKKLSPTDRYKLKIMLEAKEINEQDIEASKQAAGGWADIDAIKDIYKKRCSG